MNVLKQTLKEHSGYLLLAAGLLVLLLFVTPASAFSGSGAGTSGDPYQITTTGQWNEMNNALSAYYKLMNDIDFGSGTITVAGAQFNEFNGNVDGNGKAIKNGALGYRTNVDSSHLMALFFGNPYVKDLTLINIDGSDTAPTPSSRYSWLSINGGSFHQVFIDSTSSMTITDFKAGDRIGGIACNEIPYIDQCGVLGSITVDSDVAGYVGGVFAYLSSGNAAYAARLTNSYYGGTQTFSGGHTNVLHGGFGGSVAGTLGNYCYYDSDKSPGDGTSGINSKTTSEMTTQGTFTGWTFDSTHWRMSYASPAKFLGYPVWYKAYDPPSAPSAAFTLSTQSLYPGNAVVTLTDTSSNTPTSWLWQFGDGTANSTTQSLNHTFTQPSTTTQYTVTLTATNAGGSSSTTHAVTFWRAPVANFTADKTSFVANGANDAVTFTDTSSNGAVSWLYHVTGAGAPSDSTSQNPTMHFTNPNINDVSFTATNPAGTSTMTKTWYIYARSPVTSVTMLGANPNPQNAGGLVEFVGGMNFAGEALDWGWDFGDGSARTKNAYHTYSMGGVYNAGIGVKDYDNAWHYNNTTAWVTIIGAVTADFTMNQSSGNYPLTVKFTDITTGGTFASAVWNFGDGGSSTLQSPTHTFTTAGTYSVSLLWTNTVAESGYVTKAVTVTSPSTPAVYVQLISPQAPYNHTGIFEAFPSGGVPPYTYLWNFPDNSTATTKVATYTHIPIGAVTVSCQVTDSYSHRVTSTPITAYIYANPTPTVSFTKNKTSGNYPLTVGFTATTTGGLPPYTIYEWTFGDGGTSSSANPTHTFATAGSYTVTLNLTDSYPHSAIASTTVTATDPTAPSAGWTSNVSTGYYPLTVAFTDASSGGVAPFTYAWTFEPGHTSTSASPTYTFASPGSYAVTQVITDSYTHTDYETKTIVVTAAQHPVANFTTNVTSGLYPLTIRFTDTSTSTNPAIVVFNWGDGTTTQITQGSYIDHVFTTAGYYTVTQAVTDYLAAPPYDFKSVNVHPMQAGAPTTLFQMNETTGNIPFTIQFTDQTTGSPTQWNWSFGDGSTSILKNPTHTYTTAGTSYVYRTVSLTTVTTGGTSTLSETITAKIPAPVPAFTFPPNGGQAPVAIAFTDTSTVPTVPSGIVNNYIWDFGDGSATSTTQSPTHTYTAGGTYTVVETVANFGGVASVSHPVSITAPAGINIIPVTPTPTPVALSGEIVVYPVYNISTTSEPEVAIGSQFVIDANTTGIKKVGNYNVDGWQVQMVCILYHDPSVTNIDPYLYIQDGFPVTWSMNADTNQTYTYTMPARFPATDAWKINGYEDYATFNLYAVNNTAPDTGYGQGKMFVATDSMLYKFVPPTFDWAWATMTRNPQPGELVEAILSHNSENGLLAQQTLNVYVEQSVDGKNVDDATKVWTTYAGYPINPVHTTDAAPQAIVFYDTPATSMDLRGRYVYEEDYTGFYRVTGTWSYVQIQPPITTPTFLWKNIGGGTVTSALDTDTIKWGLDTGNVWESKNYPTLTITYYKYNVATGVWDVLSTPAPASMPWGAQTLKTSGTIALNTVFTSTDSSVKLRAVVRGVGTGATNIIVTSSDLTIQRNAVNPTNVANAAGGWMGLDAGLGGILFGTIISVIIGLLAFLLIRDARVFLVGGMAGVAISFALGLYPLWLIIIIGIAGVAALLFASGVLNRGEGGNGNSGTNLEG